MVCGSKLNEYRCEGDCDNEIRSIAPAFFLSLLFEFLPSKAEVAR